MEKFLKILPNELEMMITFYLDKDKSFEEYGNVNMRKLKLATNTRGYIDDADIKKFIETKFKDRGHIMFIE